MEVGVDAANAQDRDGLASQDSDVDDVCLEMVSEKSMVLDSRRRRCWGFHRLGQPDARATPESFQGIECRRRKSSRCSQNSDDLGLRWMPKVAVKSSNAFSNQISVLKSGTRSSFEGGPLPDLITG